MTLTTDELRTLHAARLEQLVSELMAATRDGDPGAFDKASEALVDFRASVPFPDLKTEAANAREAAAAETIPGLRQSEAEAAAGLQRLNLARDALGGRTIYVADRHGKAIGGKT